MAYLSVKLDHIALLREARKNRTPDLTHAAVLAEMAGVDGITVHLRRDTRHVRDRDLYILREVVRSRLTVEIAATPQNISRVQEVKPYMVIFVPEEDKEITTQAGVMLDNDYDLYEDAVRRLQEVGVKVGVHIEPSAEMVKQAARLRADAVKFHTGYYASARTEEEGLAELARLERAAAAAGKADQIVIAGQGIDYRNVLPMVRLEVIDEFIVGQAIVARAVMVGMERAAAEMLELVRYEKQAAKS